jgi:uncharacterized hydrophobic protein (TIGR00271 family)
MENKNEKNENPSIHEHSFGYLMVLLWKKIIHFFQEITNIHQGSDQVGTINSIMANKTMTGANVWLLFSAIIVASIGLDTNSPAVIIGAMLISPLMSPILGIGLSVAINNRLTLRISLKHFGIAIVVSLVTSFLYFLLTPLSSVEPTSEMLARTSPTFLDVLVAFFGGIAGVVSGTRLEKSNAIPGVAIATALLPPLCVAGYGLAHGEWWIFLNGFYLFFINSVFVALATYLIVRLLDFPFKQYVSEKERRRSKLLIIGFVFLVVVPSTFIFFNVLKDLRQKQFVKQYVAENFETTFNTTDKIDGTDTLELTVFWFGKPINSTDSLEHAKTLSENRVNFRVIQSNYGQEYAGHVRRSMQSEELLKALQDEKKSKERLIEEQNALQVKLEDLEKRRSLLSSVSKEYKATYPELERIGFAEVEQTTDSTNCIYLPTLFFDWNKKTPKSKITDYEKRIAIGFQKRFELDTIVIQRY